MSLIAETESSPLRRSKRRKEDEEDEKTAAPPVIDASKEPVEKKKKPVAKKRDGKAKVATKAAADKSAAAKAAKEEVKSGPPPPSVTVTTMLLVQEQKNSAAEAEMDADMMALVRSVLGDKVTEAAWRKSGGKMALVRAAVEENALMMQELMQLKDCVREVVEVLDDEARHGEFFDKMTTLAAMANRDDSET